MEDLAAIAVGGVGPLLVLVAIKELGRVHGVQLKWLLAGLVWGAAMFYVALRLNTAVYSGSGWSRDTVVNFVAPAIEEVLKALFILWLVRSKRVSDAAHGLLYGFAAGIGFAAVENVFYVAIGGGLDSSFIRLGSTTLMHASSTALIGLAILKLHVPAPAHHPHWFERRPHVAVAGALAVVALKLGLLKLVVLKGLVLKGVLVRSLLVADGRHSGFNVLVARPIDTAVIVSAVAVGVVFTAFMLFTARRLTALEARPLLSSRA